MSQINALDASLERARNAYDSATAKLHAIQESLRINRIGLDAARANLVRAQATLEQRLFTIYTSRDDESTLAVLLGSQSLDDLVNRIETVQSVSEQDAAVMGQVVTFKHEVTARQNALVHARQDQVRLVQQRADAKARIGSQLGQQQRLLTSIKGEIAHLIALQHARALAQAQAAQAQLQAAQQQQSLALQGTAVGASASTPDGK
jgi:peptidoglycan hydrolase CwlO-like protein